MQSKISVKGKIQHLESNISNPKDPQHQHGRIGQIEMHTHGDLVYTAMEEPNLVVPGSGLLGNLHWRFTEIYAQPALVCA